MRKSAGISFIEIIISLLLVSIIVLGVFAFHTQQTKQAVTLKQYMLGNIGLRNIAEKMLANPDGAQAGFYANDFKSSVKDCIKSSCTAKEIADYDINQTVLEMQEYLPYFKLSIKSNNSGEHTLSADWQGIDKNQALKLNIQTP